ncbi:DUF397 domain-containing protein [Streptomyces shaanxiensis]
MTLAFSTARRREQLRFPSTPVGTLGDSCVEVALTGQAAYVRDSKELTRPHFAVGRAGWSRFVGFVAEI